MADLRRRKPDDDSGKQVDDENFSAIKQNIGDAASGSDDEQPHHKKPSGLTTADSSDHVNINKKNNFFPHLNFSSNRFDAGNERKGPFQSLFLCLFHRFAFSKEKKKPNWQCHNLID